MELTLGRDLRGRPRGRKVHFREKARRLQFWKSIHRDWVGRGGELAVWCSGRNFVQDLEDLRNPTSDRRMFFHWVGDHWDQQRNLLSGCLSVLSTLLGVGTEKCRWSRCGRLCSLAFGTDGRPVFLQGELR